MTYRIRAHAIGSEQHGAALAWFLAGLGFVTGFLSDRYLGLDPLLIGEFAAAAVIAAAVLARPPIKGHGFGPTIALALVFSLAFGTALLIAGDDAKIATMGSGKLALFFLSAFSLFYVPQCCQYVIALLLALISGVVASRYGDGTSIAAVAKYTAPPLYVMLVIGIAITSSRERASWPFWSLLTAIAVYAAITGSYRGSLIGAAILVFFVVIASLRSTSRAIFRSRRILPAIALAFTAAIPLILVKFISIDWLLQSTWATKSNVERLGSMSAALSQIEQHPLFGNGISNSFLELRRIFGLRLGGFSATSSVHNQILDATLFAGAVGAAAFLILYSTLLCKTLATLAPRPLTTPLKPWHDLVGVAATISILNLVIAAPFGSASRVYELLCIAAVGMVLRRTHNYEPGQPSAGAPPARVA